MKIEVASIAGTHRDIVEIGPQIPFALTVAIMEVLNKFAANGYSVEVVNQTPKVVNPKA